MRRTLMTSASVAALAIGACASTLVPARADEFGAGWGADWYVSLFGGGTFAGAVEDYYGFVYDTRLKDGFTVGGAVGTVLYPGLRGEIELSWQNNENRDIRPFVAPRLDIGGDTDVVFMFANLWKDFGQGFIRPYVGGGIGAGIATTDSDVFGVISRIDDSAVGFAGQLGAGIRVPVTDRLTFDLGYRFRALVNAGLTDNESYYAYNAVTSIFSHTAQAGFTYALGDPVHALSAGNSDPLDSLWYVSLFGGLSSPQNGADVYYDYVYSLNAKDGFTVGGAVGTYVAPSLRGELEIAYSRHAFDNYTYYGGQSALPLDGHQSQLSFLVNFWKEFHVFSLSPYIGGGVGVGLNMWEDTSFDGGPLLTDTAVGLATQFGFGVRYAIAPNLTADAGYRFRNITGSLLVVEGSGGHEKVSTAEHVFQVGLTYAFGGPVPVAASADAGPGGRDFYVSVFGGGAFPQSGTLISLGYVYEAEMKDGFTLGAAVGTDIVPGLRGELEVSYLQTDADAIDGLPFIPAIPTSGGTEQLFVLANLWKDIELGLPLTPYVGGGVGLAVVDLEMFPLVFPGWDDTTVSPAAQLGAGVQLAVTDGLSLDVGYRFKAAFEGLAEGHRGAGFPHAEYSFYTHVFQAGLNWNF